MRYAAILKNISASDLKNTLPPNGSPTQKNFCDFRIGRFRKISEMLGYENTEYFIALFKRYEHTTPLAFRKKWQNLRA